MNSTLKLNLKKARYILTALSPTGKLILTIFLVIIFGITLYAGMASFQNYDFIFYGLILSIIVIIIGETLMISSPQITYKGENMLDFSKNVSLNKFLPLSLKSLKIFTGEFNSNFYDKDIINEFRQLYDNGVIIEAVFGPNFDLDCDGILEMAIEGKIRLYELPTRDAVKIPHFRLIDGMHVCGDFKRHRMLRGYSGGGFWLNNLALGKEMEKRFDIVVSRSCYKNPEEIRKMIQEAKPITSEEMEKKFGFIKRDKESKEPRPATLEEIRHLQQKVLRA